MRVYTIKGSRALIHPLYTGQNRLNPAENIGMFFVRDDEAASSNLATPTSKINDLHDKDDMHPCTYEPFVHKTK